MSELILRRTARLFARPSFIEGYGRAIDLGATLNEYNQSKTEEEADTDAILSDWLAVGDSLNYAIEHFSQEHTESV